MIRLIKRRLIIPRGDTGSFTIPALPSMGANDIFVFYIYDPLTKQTVCEKTFPVTPEVFTITLEAEDTINLPAKKYLWDIKVYSNPRIDEDDYTFIDATNVDSYYAAFSLPVCEIKEVAGDVPRKALYS